MGKPLRETVVGIGTWDKALSENEGRRLVIYAWVAGYPESMAVAALLAETLPPNIGLIGINLDRDVALAQAAAAEHKLPATQFYDPAGPEGHVANALALKSVPLVYLVDADGVIISVSAHRDPAALVASLSTP